jgi:hypothetical protein
VIVTIGHVLHRSNIFTKSNVRMFDERVMSVAVVGWKSLHTIERRWKMTPHCLPRHSSVPLITALRITSADDHSYRLI